MYTSYGAFHFLHPPAPSSLLGPFLLGLFLNILYLYFAPAIVDTSGGRNYDGVNEDWEFSFYFPLNYLCLVDYKHKLVSSNQ